MLAYSSGNHAQGVAWAAAAHGAAGGDPDALGRAGGEDRRRPGRSAPRWCSTTGRRQDRDALGARLAAARGLSLIPPFDHPQVIAGQGTVGLEIAAQAAEAGVGAADVLVCCGGGGLSAGIALALEAEAPGLRVRTAEPAGFDDMARSLARRRAAGQRRRRPARSATRS